jgi:AcrR family transcriptional regulator
VTKKETSRQSIIETALRLAKEEGIASLTIARVAGAAGMTRQAVYWHFKTRTQLLLDVSNHFDSQLEDADLMFAGLPDRPAIESLEAMMRAWLTQLPHAAPMLLALHAESLTDPEARDALSLRFADLSRVMETVYLKRLQNEGSLREGLDLREASQLLLVAGSPPVWHQLTAILGWSHETYVSFVMAQVRTLILRHP